MDRAWDDEGKNDDERIPVEVGSKTTSSSKGISSQSLSISSQLAALNPEKIY